MQSRSKLLQSISELFIIWTFHLQTLYVFFVVALVASFRSTPDYQVTDHLFHGQKPWTELQIVTRSLFKVSSLDQRTLWTVNLHLSTPPEWWTCAGMQIPSVTGALIRLSLCHWILVSRFTSFSSVLEFCSLRSVTLYFETLFLSDIPTSNVKRTVNVLIVFLSFSVSLLQKVT